MITAIIVFGLALVIFILVVDKGISKSESNCLQKIASLNGALSVYERASRMAESRSIEAIKKTKDFSDNVIQLRKEIEKSKRPLLQSIEEFEKLNPTVVPPGSPNIWNIEVPKPPIVASAQPPENPIAFVLNQIRKQAKDFDNIAHTEGGL